MGHRRQHYGKQAKQSTPLTSGIVVVCGNPLVAAPVTLHGHCDGDTVVRKVLVPGIAAAAYDLARLGREGMVELVHCWVLGATDTAAQVRLFLHNPQWRLDEIFLPALHWGHSLTVGDHVLVGAAPARDCFTENIPLVQTGRLLGRWNTIHSVSPMEWNTKRCSHRTRSNEILRLSRPPGHAHSLSDTGAREVRSHPYWSTALSFWMVYPSSRSAPAICAGVAYATSGFQLCRRRTTKSGGSGRVSA